MGDTQVGGGPHRRDRLGLGLVRGRGQDIDLYKWGEGIGSSFTMGA